MLEELGRENVVNQIPVFLITGETDDRVIKKAYDLGVMDVIPKLFLPTSCGAASIPSSNFLWRVSVSRILSTGKRLKYSGRPSASSS